ncbi:MAG TPA: hypothetical protein VEZ12_18815 [Herpetosiphonaceae bacterium]|nr:hypothetical protein [Herpetosiphonaceae bacterium]
MQEATGKLDVGTVPRGIYVDLGGAQMHALFEFPAVAEPAQGQDAICPCIKIQNRFDATSRITAKSPRSGSSALTSQRRGGVFAGGFMAVHAGEMMPDELAVRLSTHLTNFEVIVATYRCWSEQPLNQGLLDRALKPLPKQASETIRLHTTRQANWTVYHAYKTATHELKSVRSAFNLLEEINQRFQRCFSIN